MTQPKKYIDKETLKAISKIFESLDLLMDYLEQPKKIEPKRKVQASHDN